MRLMITGGGTGGHTSPAVAVIEELSRRDPRLIVQWVGGRRSIEERVCAARGIPFRAVTVAAWPRRGRLRKAWAAARLGAGALQAYPLLKRFRPDVVLGVGGYVSVPLGLMAQRMGIPTVLHEQNKRLGMANRLLAKDAHRILLSYPDTEGEYPRDRARVVGNPVRAGFLNPPDTASARQSFDLDPRLPVVLVSGGSQGARTLNRAVSGALEGFREGELQLIWMTGKDFAPEARVMAGKAKVPVRVYAFIDDMPAACAAASLIVSRAGASTAAEIAALGKPSILVPYPYATDAHQEENARAFVEAGAAVLLHDAECTAEKLAGTLRTLLADPARLDAMGKAALSLAQPAAVEDIAEEILEIAFKPVEERA